MEEKSVSYVDQVLDFIVKFIIPAIVGISIRVAMTVQKEKITPLKVALSFIVGVGFVLLLKDVVTKYIDSSFQPAIFGLIAMSGEYIGRFLIGLFSLDIRIKVIIDFIFEKIAKILGMGKLFSNLLSITIGTGLIYFGVSLEFSEWMRIFLIMIGIVMIFSRDTLISRTGQLIDTAVNFITRKKD